MTVRSEPLVQLVRNYTNALRYTIHKILLDPPRYGRWRYVKRTRRIKWEPDIKILAREFYYLLKEKFNLPAKFSIGCIGEASFMAKSVLNNENNEDKKCVIRSYRARCDNQTYKIELKDGKCFLKPRNFGEIEVAGFNLKWLAKFKD